MDSERVQPLVVFVSLVIAVVGMLANGFVVAAIFGDKFMRHNSMYLLLANLVSAATYFMTEVRDFSVGYSFINQAMHRATIPF